MQSGTDCMQLKSMFNQPLSVRGIKSIEIWKVQFAASETEADDKDKE